MKKKINWKLIIKIVLAIIVSIFVIVNLGLVVYANVEYWNTPAGEIPGWAIPYLW